MNHQKKISVVITVYNETVYNEQDNVMPLANALDAVLEIQPYDYEIIFVDDGSVDDTYKILRRAQTKICNLTIIRLKRNLGQTPRFFCRLLLRHRGLYHQHGRAICKTIPKIFPNCSKQLRENMMLSVAGANTAKILQPNGSFREAFNLIRYLIFRDPVHDTSCSLKIFRSEAVKSLLPLRSKMHGCLTSMLYLRGYKVGEIVVTHRPRIHGETKYRNPFRDFSHFLDVTLCSILVALHPSTAKGRYTELFANS